MKRKLWIAVLTALSVLCLALGLAACGGTPAKGHQHSYQWVDNGNGTHKQHCSNAGCDAPDINSGSHVWGANNKCEQCGAIKPAEGHSHNYEWVDNGDGTHKQHCSNSGCDTPDINSGSHDFGTNGTCVCGAVKPAATAGLDYELLDDNTYGVAGVGEAVGVADIVIPEVYDGKSVTKILEEAFFAPKENPDTTLKSVVIPESVTEIGGYAFAHCQALANVSFGGTKIIRDSAFWDTGLVSVDLSGVVTVEDDAFYNVETLKSVMFGSTTETLGTYSFAYCYALESVDFGGVKVIGDYAFRECSALESLVVPSSVTEMGDYAFYASGIKTLVLEDGISALGVSAFYYCTSLKAVTIPGSITEIPKYAFQSTGIETLIIEDGVETILNTAFANCDSLREVYLPSTLKELTGGPFLNTTGIERVYVDSIADWCQIDFGSVDSNPVRGKGQLYVDGKPLGSELVIPEGVKKIGTYAFRWFDNLQKVVLPDSLEEIGKCAFLYCTGIYSLTVGTNLNKITAVSRTNTNGSFYGCYRLIEVLDRSSTTYFNDIDFQLSSASEMGRLETTADGFLFYIGNGVVSLLGYDGPETVVPALPTSGPVGDGTYELHRDFIVANNTNRTLPLDFVIPDCVTKLGSNSLYDNNFYLRESPTFDSLVIGSGVKEVLTDCRVKTVYYKGTQTEFKALFSSWDSYYALQNAAENYYYYSETRPTQSGKFWHYDGNGNPTVW